MKFTFRNVDMEVRQEGGTVQVKVLDNRRDGPVQTPVIMYLTPAEARVTALSLTEEAKNCPK